MATFSCTFRKRCLGSLRSVIQGPRDSALQKQKICLLLSGLLLCAETSGWKKSLLPLWPGCPLCCLVTGLLHRPLSSRGRGLTLAARGQHPFHQLFLSRVWGRVKGQPTAEPPSTLLSERVTAFVELDPGPSRGSVQRKPTGNPLLPLDDSCPGKPVHLPTFCRHTWFEEARPASGFSQVPQRSSYDPVLVLLRDRRKARGFVASMNMSVLCHDIEG